jgi:hypothetical protein
MNQLVIDQKATKRKKEEAKKNAFPIEKINE